MSTYAYDVMLGQLERAQTQNDVDTLIREYSIYVRGMLESQYPSKEVTAERIVRHVGADVGWMLGEISSMARQHIVPMLPEQVQHPVLGRDFDVSIDELMLAGANWIQGLPRGGAA